MASYKEHIAARNDAASYVSDEQIKAAFDAVNGSKG